MLVIELSFHMFLNLQDFASDLIILSLKISPRLIPHSIRKCDAQFAQRRGIARVAFRCFVAVDVVVEDVALLRREAGGADEVAEHSFVGFVVRAGGGDDVLFDHNRTHIVCAEA